MIVRELLNVLITNNITAFTIDGIRYNFKKIPVNILDRTITSIKIVTETKALKLTDLEYDVCVPDVLSNMIEQIDVDLRLPNTPTYTEIKIEITLK